MYARGHCCAPTPAGVRRTLAPVALAALIVVSSAVAQMAADERSLPDYDARLMDAAVRESVQRDAAARDTAARRAAVAKLATTVPYLRVDFDANLATPQYIGSPMRLLTGPVSGRPVDAKQVVRGFVRRERALLGVGPAELDRAVAIRDFYTAHNGVRHLTWQQQVGGIDLFMARLRTSVTARGEIVNLSSTLLEQPAGDFDVPDWRLAPAEAVALAAANVGIVLTGALLTKQAAVGPAARQIFARTADFADDVAVARVYFPLTAARRGGIRPAYAVTVPEIGIGNVYDIIVDGVSGAVLYRTNRLHFAASESITFNVFTSDSPAPGSPGSPTPDDYQFPPARRSLVTVNAADVAPFSPNGWIDDGANETVGNNCDAHTDLNADDNPDLPRPMGNPYRVFDFPLDLAQPPATYRPAAITQLFYWGNLYHDRFYALGFDGPAGNFQQDNFGVGGVDGDRLQLDAQDGSGVNNANFIGSGVDGSTGRVQMFVWSDPDPARDGDLDGEIVFHELTHGVSIRLHEGTLLPPQGSGMGEGWSDFFALLLHAAPDDDVDAVYACGAYVAYQLLGLTDNYYFGIRRFPYSTDLNKAPQTLADIDPTQQSFPLRVPISPVVPNLPNEIHNVGEIWCSAFLECRANLAAIHGFAANQQLLQLVIDGMKLSPGNPNFLQARDAVLQAELIASDGADALPLWLGFAKRGMGLSATVPAATTTAGIVEAYDTPRPTLTFSYPAGQPDIVTPNAVTPILVQTAPLFSGMAIPGSGQLHFAIDDAAFAANPLTELGPGEYEGQLPPADCGHVIHWYVSLQEVSGTLISDPADAPETTYHSVAATGSIVILDDDFETDLGWTVGAAGDAATSGVWVRVDPTPTAAQPDDDYSVSGTHCYVTGNAAPGAPAGAADVDGGATSLVSPPLDLSGGDAEISYARWYSNDTATNPFNDVFVVSISNDDGQSWTTAETLGPIFQASGGWHVYTFRVSDLVVPTAAVRVKFVASDPFPTSSIVEAAVDEFNVVRYLCGATTPVIVLANPPLDNPFVPGVQPFRDVLDAGDGGILEGIGGASTPNAGSVVYGTISVTFDGVPTTPPVPSSISVTCTGGQPAACPSVTSVVPPAGGQVGPYVIALSSAIPPGQCTTLSFDATSPGQRLHYQSLPGDINFDGLASASDVLALVVAFSNGAALDPDNLPRYNIDRHGSVGAIDLLRLVQVLNGFNSPRFLGVAVASCPP